MEKPDPLTCYPYSITYIFGELVPKQTLNPRFLEYMHSTLLSWVLTLPDE